MTSYSTDAPAGWPMDTASQAFLTPVPVVAFEPNVAAAPLCQSSQQPPCLPDAALVQPQHQVFGCQPLTCLPLPYQQQHCEPHSWCPPQPCQRQPFQQHTFQQQPLQPQPFHQQPCQQLFHVAAPQQHCLSHLQQPATPMVVHASGVLAAQPTPPVPVASLDEREVMG